MKTIEVKTRRIPGMIISLLLLYLTAAVSIFVLKVAFVLAAVAVIFKGLSVDPGSGVLPQALNLNARVAMAASVLGDVLLGAMLADGSDPAAPLMSDTAKLSLLIDGSKL